MARIHERYLKNPVAKDLEDRMVFIGGPRQAVNTTFALTVLPEATEKHPAYLNSNMEMEDTKTYSLNSFLEGPRPKASPVLKAFKKYRGRGPSKRKCLTKFPDRDILIPKMKLTLFI